MSNTRNCYNLTWNEQRGRHPDEPSGDPFWSCHYHCLNQHNAAACASLPDDPYTPAFDRQIHSITDEYQVGWWL